METKLVPATNEDSFEEVARKIRLVEEIAGEFGLDETQIDVSDGTFTPTTVWHEPMDLVGFETKLKLDLHLMISDMDTRVGDWLMEPVKKITFHLEAARDPQFVLEKIKKSGREAGLAVNPETPVEKLEPFFDKADSFLILGVNPGASGQGILSGTAEKIRALRKMCPGCIIGIDGGVTPKNAKELVRAGANYIIAASAIFNSKDIKKTILDLQNETK